MFRWAPDWSNYTCLNRCGMEEPLFEEGPCDKIQPPSRVIMFRGLRVSFPNYWFKIRAELLILDLRSAKLSKTSVLEQPYREGDGFGFHVGYSFAINLVGMKGLMQCSPSTNLEAFYNPSGWVCFPFLSFCSRGVQLERGFMPGAGATFYLNAGHYFFPFQPENDLLRLSSCVKLPESKQKQAIVKE